MLAVLRRVVPADAVAFAAFPEGDVNGESWSTADTTITTTAIFSSIHIRFFLFFGGGGGRGRNNSANDWPVPTRSGFLRVDPFRTPPISQWLLHWPVAAGKKNESGGTSS